MRIRSTLLPGATAIAGLLLCLAGSGEAYTFLGGSLDLDQRDFRVCNNFTDPEANDNQVPDPSFPGATGAVLAIWKACVEWGSELHGDGSGDLFNPDGLGSGGANFDASFQGLARDPGGPDDNIISEIWAYGGGVMAYCETPIADGWRIRFYQDPIVWFDGPGLPSPGDLNKDLQGIATHEYGHALGLGHSLDQSATMSTGFSTDHVWRRSLNVDDIAGVQALYGAASSTKPHLESYSVSGGVATITGTGFAASGNEVWFTRGIGLGDGTPVKATGLASTAGGTQLVATIPAVAGPGDILVRIPGSTGDCLSNAYPFDPVLGECPSPLVYGTPKITSGGDSPTLTYSGTPSVTYGDFAITIFGAHPDSPAILFYGSTPASVPFMGGTLYSSGPYVRDQFFTSGMFGEALLNIPVDSSMVGARRIYQVWFQDPGDSFGMGLSNAIEVVFCP